MDLEELNKLSKEDIIRKYLSLKEEHNDLWNDYNNLQFDYDVLQDDYADEQAKEYLQPDSETMILDISLFKDKLESYNLKSEELWNFIDLYMKLYNKE